MTKLRNDLSEGNTPSIKGGITNSLEAAMETTMNCVNTQPKIKTGHYLNIAQNDLAAAVKAYADDRHISKRRAAIILAYFAHCAGDESLVVKIQKRYRV